MLRVDLASQGADFTGRWEMLGQRAEISGRAVDENATTGHTQVI
jgi:hypothetical protein